MDYSRIIEELQQASSFDLYRLRVAINQQLESPQRIKEIKSRLKPGQTITYFDSAENRLIEAKVIKLKRTRLLVQNEHDQQRWNIPFYHVNLDSVDTDITLSTKMGLDRNQLKVGDKIGFRDRQNNDVYGTVIRLNRKTATISTDDHTKWRVGYGGLYLVLEGEQGYPKLIEGQIIDSER
ncbi:MAG: hypothetical protein U9R15_16425 [Chloroflexota bacterium]|nr:hypothetical protein [Chloroflexota bacterium]